MELNLKNKRALITGSTSGIGEGIAKGLAREGTQVIVHGRRLEEARRVFELIESEGGVAAIALGDLGTDAGAATVARQAIDAFGGVDILVNNVGKADEDSWDQPNPEAWAQSYATNVLSAVRTIRAFLPQMKERGWGRIIQVASIAGHYPKPDYAAYGAAKAAAVNLTVSLARSLAKTGVTSNAISPGVILSPEIQTWVQDMAETEGWEGEWDNFETRFTDRFMPNLVGRMGRVEEIADLVAYLASPRADFVTGAHFAIDGGHIG